MTGESIQIVAGADPFGAPLKDHLVGYLKGKGIQVEDLGVEDKYYQVGEQVGKRVASASEEKEKQVRGLLVCGTGVGVSIFANKFRGIYATPCTTVDQAVNNRSINNSNVLTLGGVVTPPEDAEKILDTWLSTEFKAPCPANGGNPWPEDVQKFLDNSLDEMQKISGELAEEPVKTEKVVDGKPADGCGVCCALAEGRKFEDVDIMPGGSWCILKENPTSAVVRFKAGSLEPGHHHTFGHDVMVIQGRKRVWNVTKNQSFDLGPGDFLYTPAGDIHRVEYFTDTEFFIRWDGPSDILLDEDLETAAAALKKDN